MALAAQQFASEILELTKDTRFFRENNGQREKKRRKASSKKGEEVRTMTLDDLTAGLQKYGVEVEKQPFEIREEEEEEE